MHIPEKFLHYLWKYRLFSRDELFTRSGEKVVVLQVGQHNPDAGPDFLNARIRIGRTIWVGNVEIHQQASDWYHHGHHHDKAYDNVVLQVVLYDNQTVYRTNHEVIPTTELRFDKALFERYRELLESEAWVACEKAIPRVDRSVIDFWLSRLTIERLEDKSREIEQNLRANNQDWEATFYQKLARNFGFKVNAEPFEMLARSLPFNQMIRQKGNLLQLEALFFGQAGFLRQKSLDDPYHMQLFDEYLYLRKKFQLKPLEQHLWKFARLRPGNFPTLRIAQFCALIHTTNRLFSHLLEKQTLQQMRALFNVQPSPYWQTHYTFHKPGKRMNKPLGEDAFQVLVINTVVPFLFVYGAFYNKAAFKERALQLLLELGPEKNTITRHWEALGIRVPNAYHSQGLIQLKNQYCNHHKCLDCQVGNYILSHGIPGSSPP